MIIILSALLLLFLYIIGKERGIKTFFTFYLSIGLIILYVILMNLGLNAILMALIICIIATIICIFMLNGYNIKTKASFISIMIVLFIVFALIYIIGKKANIQGFSLESLDSIGAFSFDINYDMTNVMIGIYLVAIIGTVIDTSISVSSAMNEILINNPKINDKELFKSGMNIGSDIMATTINTLFFALICTFIGFSMWHRGSNIGYIINYKSFDQDLIQLLISFIGSILIIPITAYISSKLLLNKKII